MLGMGGVGMKGALGRVGSNVLNLYEDRRVQIPPSAPKGFEALRSKLRGIFDRKEVCHFQIVCLQT
jgi:hypothetical protein